MAVWENIHVFNFWLLGFPGIQRPIDGWSPKELETNIDLRKLTSEVLGPMMRQSGMSSGSSLKMRVSSIAIFNRNVRGPLSTQIVWQAPLPQCRPQDLVSCDVDSR